ncbi:MAG: alpha/beta hydrolase [Rhodospirillaceae bacterium]|jgi:hypothetical protein|nr:alpha/beta hydrolase [Rhodospirillaceae bacterium]
MKFRVARNYLHAALFLLPVFVTGCAALDLSPGKRVVALESAAKAGWVREEFSTERFTLAGWLKGEARTSSELVVYIEGDGRAWISRNRLSDDPTPRDPVALRLALKDPAFLILYLARPCQYVLNGGGKNRGRGCDPVYWSARRYSGEVIAALNGAIDQAKQRTGAQTISLVGYSGGGTVAVLIAARRGDVSRLVTIAPVLDHDAWTAHHKVSPLTGSLNPVDVAASLGHLPQRYFFGAVDKIAPRRLSENFFARLPSSTPVQISIIEGFDHNCCWVAEWPGLLAPGP